MSRIAPADAAERGAHGGADVDEDATVRQAPGGGGQIKGGLEIFALPGAAATAACAKSIAAR